MLKSCGTGENNWIEEGGLNHTSNMSPTEHAKFVSAFKQFKEQTNFDEEISPFMLKYYVQMAFLEGWKNRSNHEDF